MNFQAPVIQYSELLPILIVLGGALLGVLVEAFLPRDRRYVAQVAISLVSIVAAFAAVVRLHGTSTIAAEGSVVVDGVTLFLQGTLLLLALGGVLLIAERRLDSEGGAFTAQASALPGSEAERTALATGIVQTEVFPLTLFALGGALLFPAAGDLVTMFVALEVLSLPLYLMSGLARRRRLLSQEAALKYFLLGAFSSAFFLYGAALIYGYAHTVSLGGIRTAISTSAGNDLILLIGVGLIAVGLLFKVSAVPFHAWTPDVYQGAPTPVTAFMAACTKVAAFGAILRLFYVGLGGLRWDWRPMLTGIAIVTMILGALFALTQTDMKRLLAYSSIAHAGFILTGVIAANQSGLQGSLFYLAAYGFTTIGAFAIITLVRDSSGEATHLSQWSGLGRRSPLIASTFAFFLLALAGIPLTSGFVAKFAVFSAAYASGSTALVIVGVLSSAVAAFFYVRVIVLMFFSEPKEDGTTVVIPPVMTSAAITFAAAATLILGVVPGPVLDLAKSAAQFIF
ncbi:MAG TPA: NADH-quinone oxidoreductase subunit NuoN [Candidatus Nanopelagicaceae bacterium]|nr:NADH-quinone oxidoreductase subunit NuoN [Candidatus Nanopelagicaceae bacterium]